MRLKLSNIFIFTFTTFSLVDSLCVDGFDCTCIENGCECNAGYFGSSALEGNATQTCTLCGLGTYSGNGSTTCSNCPIGLISPIGSTSINNCTSCSSGSFWNVTNCSLCPAGTYQSSSSFIGTSCLTCISGTYGIGGSQTSACSGVVSCPSGLYALPGAKSNIISDLTTCSNCPIGLISPIGSSSINNCTSCTSGSFWNVSSCSLCPSGTYQSSSSFIGTFCSDCLAGTFSTGGATTCSACGANLYSFYGASSCSSCSAGATFISSSLGCQPESGTTGAPTDTSFYLSCSQSEGVSAFLNIVKPHGISYYSNISTFPSTAIIFATGSYVSTSSVPALPTGSSAFTISAWIKCASTVFTSKNPSSVVLAWGSAAISTSLSAATLAVTSSMRYSSPSVLSTILAGDGIMQFVDGTGTNSKFNYPAGMTLDSSGNIYIADKSNHRIRKITSIGVVTTLAGSGSASFLDGTGIGASFNNPTGVAVDSLGNVYVADFDNNRIRKITSSGLVSTLAGQTSFGSTDGSGTNAMFNTPSGVAVDVSGNVYVCDFGNHRIRRITSSGVVTTLVGSDAGYLDATGTSAMLFSPIGIAIDTFGHHLFISESGNHIIRMISISSLTVTTLAGSGTSGFSDGIGTNANFNSPVGISVDTSGNVYVADSANNRIRRISTTTNSVITIAGNNSQGFSEGINSVFNLPIGLVVNSVGGTIYVSDQFNHRIRTLTLSTSQLPGPLPACDSTWRQVAIAYTGVNSRILSSYIDGRLFANVSATYAIGSSGSTLRMGTNGISSGELFTGSISDVRVYNRYLSSSEIATLSPTCPSGWYSDTGAIPCKKCSSGSYSSLGATYCATCPAGYVCDSGINLCAAGSYSTGGSSSCLPCPQGTYANATGSQSCLPCPAGYSCLNPAHAPIMCLGGYFSASRDGVCTACAPGTYSISTNASTFCKLCPAGTFGLSSALSSISGCILCSPGYFSSALGASSPSTCIACPSGTYNSSSGISSLSSCTSCIGGTYSLSGSSQCITCDPGFYSPMGGSSCLACPKGTYSGLKATNCTVCEPGTYATSIASISCTICPIGSSCADTTTSPIACGPGSYSLLGSPSCSSCPAGFACNGTSTSPIACLIGTYSVLGSSSCTSVRPGEAFMGTSHAPLLCSPGTYSLGGGSNCQNCSAGYMCPQPFAAPIACQSGWYSFSGSTNCTLCPAGYFCETTYKTPVMCNAGFFSKEGQTFCSGCAAGYACNSPLISTPIACVPGTYSIGNASYCTPCAAGFACTSTIFNSSIPCKDGSYSRGGSTVCSPCPAGWVCPSKTGAKNIQCLPGTYADENNTLTKCNSCLPGFACPVTTSSTAMIECGAGTYSLHNYTSCINCPSGSYCFSNSSLPSTCPAGFYTLASGGATNCTSCPAGFACPSTSSSYQIVCLPGSYAIPRLFNTPSTHIAHCTACPAGSMCPNVTSLPTPCPIGSYSSSSSISCTICPAGYFCNITSVVPFLVEAGYYSLANATVQSPCRAGYLCPPLSTSPTPTGAECPEGGYCLASTLLIAQKFIPCPNGTFGNGVKGGTNQSESCFPCTAGYYCSGLGTTEATRILCQPGSYCPEGSTSPIQCNAGYYNSIPGAINISMCLPCLEGRYCRSGSIDGDTVCAAGFYCPTASPIQMECPAGSYSGVNGLTTQSGCQGCPPGSYCLTNSSSPTLCAAGSYQPVSNSTDCVSCPAGWVCGLGTAVLTQTCRPGYYCPVNSTSAFTDPCPDGFYTDMYNITEKSGCTPCPPGFTCAAGTGGSIRPERCPTGFFCPGQSGSPTIGTNLVRLISTACPCPSGKICACPPGTYSTQTGIRYSTGLLNVTACDICPPGHFCDGSITTAGIITGPCAAGYYCPAGTQSVTSNSTVNGTVLKSYPCETGTYATGISIFRWRQEDCTECPPGFYCGNSSGQISTTACPRGTFKSTTRGKSVSECTQCPQGHICSSLGMTAPIECLAGTYSGLGEQFACSICPAGRFCYTNATTASIATASNSVSVISCPAGMYCPSGTSIIPSLQTHACPSGYYCVKGTSVIQPCSPGSYGPLTGYSSQSNCTLCPAGSYCIGGQSTISGPCASGYYCLAGSSKANSKPCPSTTYRNSTGALSLSDCALCPSGKLCKSTGTFSPTSCPAGSYCPPGSSSETPCPIGTFNPTTGARTGRECIACLPGFYCSHQGQVNVTGPCHAEYYCLAGSNTPEPKPSWAPNSSIPLPIGGRCTEGGYCPEGSSAPSPCPPGTFSSTIGASNISSCSPCTSGYYCEGSSEPKPTGPCLAGSYCEKGSSSPRQYITPEGKYSLKGASLPTPCPQGTRQPARGSSWCEPCPATRICNDPNGTIVGEVCPSGSYCPIASRTCKEFNGTIPCDFCPIGSECLLSSSILCPKGTFLADVGKSNVTECTPCSPKFACTVAGLTLPDTTCLAGYYCLTGSESSSPSGNKTGSGPCPAGFYCPAATDIPLPCPPGTFSNILGLRNSSECTTCLAGSYCNSYGQTNVTGPCRGGYYCPTGQISDAPSLYPCPRGSACPVGSAHPTPCLAGTFSNTTHLASCLLCEIRTYCPNSGMTVGFVCPQGQFCSGGNNTGPCPKGTYSAVTSLAMPSECTPCTAGYYCDELGMTIPIKQCGPGYYCSGGAFVAQPNDSTGGPCAAGYVCGYGSTGPIPSIGITGIECPVGSYCNGTSSAILCPEGTYQDSPIQGSCKVCPPGYYCKY
jgi:sugar lactone lactonase YvrE